MTMQLWPLFLHFGALLFARSLISLAYRRIGCQGKLGSGAGIYRKNYRQGLYKAAFCQQLTSIHFLCRTAGAVAQASVSRREKEELRPGPISPKSEQKPATLRDRKRRSQGCRPARQRRRLLWGQGMSTK